MKERLACIIVAAVLGVVGLLLLPPGVSARLSAGASYVTKPAQAWSDCAARVARAALGGEDGDAAEASEEELSVALARTREALAQARLEYRAAAGALEQMRRDIRLLRGNVGLYPSQYAVAFAKVVKRDPLISYYDTVMIDKGSNDGLKAGQYVAGMPSQSSGEVEFIGVVQEVSAMSARVRLMTHPELAVACAVPSRGVMGVLRGMEREASGGLAIEQAVTHLVMANPMGKNYDMIVPGDKVYTSGMGEDEQGVPNLQIGVVAQATLREDGMPMILLKPSATLWNVSHVMVILGTTTGKR